MATEVSGAGVGVICSVVYFSSAPALRTPLGFGSGLDMGLFDLDTIIYPTRIIRGLDG